VIALVENNPRALQSNSAAVSRRFSDGNVPLNGQRTTRRDKARPTIEELREYLDYEPETGVLRWRKAPKAAVKAGAIVKTVNGRGYVQVGFKGFKFLAHRAAFALHHGRWPQPACDHINCNKTDNRAINLRECTRSANSQNRSAQSNNSTGAKGVSRCGNGYRAHARLNGVQHTKYFRHFKDAAVYVKQLREQLHGEFARH
jgi:hypothetical protein